MRKQMKGEGRRANGGIGALVAEVAALRRRTDASDMKLGGPATPQQIKNAERKARTRFPRSYAAFLARHNGWLGFWPDWSLLGVSGKLTEEMRQDVEQSLALARDAVENDAALDDRDPADAWSELEKKERRNPRVIHPLRHLVFGTDFNAGLLLFDGNRVHRGEPEVVAVRNGQFEQRWKSFEQLLRAAIADLKKQAPAGTPRHRISR